MDKDRNLTPPPDETGVLENDDAGHDGIVYLEDEFEGEEPYVTKNSAEHRESDPEEVLETINDSQFNMWRAIFAFSLIDEKIGEEAIFFLAKILELTPFSPEQSDILKRDFHNPPDVIDTFMKIGNPEDRSTFFQYARKQVWQRGNRHQKILDKLQRVQVENTDFQDIVGKVDLSFDDG